MNRLLQIIVFIAIMFAALAGAQNAEQGSKPSPAPEMQRLAKMLVGEWSVDEDFATGGTMPNGGKGTGHTVIRPGPGGFSLIEELVSNSPTVHQHNIIWWDKKAQGFKALGCEDFSGEGCGGEDGLGRWQGNEVVWQLSVEKDGKIVPAKIVWAEKGKGAFAATMYIADANGTLRRDWTFLHTPVK